MIEVESLFSAVDIYHVLNNFIETQDHRWPAYPYHSTVAFDVAMFFMKKTK